ncbi:colicin immunity domain-containing protein [Variovorax saccharolyticus]|uniref:colicin immunity domain-containing protein n=1 Tax=Variovorax saccharolyticus TaxID=3053516 RepID=UPI00257825CE|nr:colicin immunity domain-containing protein [Variovorax sp. J31P216]MDM0030452.1 colicin immunity domain-containing protein [Variovorax sp. J31P216]
MEAQWSATTKRDGSGETVTFLMREIGNWYRMLLNEFLVCRMNVDEFQTEYVRRFKSEIRLLDTQLYDLLEEVYGDVDAYTSDHELLLTNPLFYIDETGLRSKIQFAVDRLSRFV